MTSEKPHAPILKALKCADHPAAKDAVPLSQFTGAMSTLASTVTIVTAAHADTRHGRTVTAMLSLSAEPPSVLVSITRDSDLAHTIEKAQAFSLEILAQGQDPVADSFAGFGSHDKFSAGQWDLWASGQPRLTGSMADLDCVLAGAIEMDTHILFAGIVTHTRTYPDRAPLLWHRRRYVGLDASALD